MEPGVTTKGSESTASPCQDSIWLHTILFMEIEIVAFGSLMKGPAEPLVCCLARAGCVRNTNELLNRRGSSEDLLLSR